LGHHYVPVETGSVKTGRIYPPGGQPPGSALGRRQCQRCGREAPASGSSWL